MKDESALTNEYQKQEFNDFNVDLFKQYSKNILKGESMIEDYEKNSNFISFVSTKWIFKHSPSGARLIQMNKQLKAEKDAAAKAKEKDEASAKVKLASA